MAQTGKLRILVVDDSIETREYLRKLLQFEDHIDVVGMAANGRDAVDLAFEEKPDLILMDINMPVMDGIAAAEIIFREMPAVRVVMMSVQSEMAYLRRAMQVGAREFLIKPFTYEELMNILGEVSSLAPTPVEAMVSAPVPGLAAAPVAQVMQGTLIAVFSPRGGAGCSTVALNLAVALQGERKANVMLMDGNLRFGALDAMLNLQVLHSIVDLLPSLSDSEPELLDSVSLPHSTGIRLLAAPPSPEMADMVTIQHMEQIIALGQRRYDYVVADLGSNLDDMTLKFMDAANRILVLLTPDIPAIKNVRLFIDVAMSLDYESEKMLLVLNRANPRGGIDAAAIQRHLKLPIVASIPYRPRTTQAAINRGVPLILYEREINKQMPVTRQLLALTKLVPQPGAAVPAATAVHVAAQAEERAPPPIPVPQPQKRRFFDRLFGRRK